MSKLHQWMFLEGPQIWIERIHMSCLGFEGLHSYLVPYLPRGAS